MGELKYTTLKNIISKYAEMNVSEKAVETFAQVVDEFMKNLATSAATFARHAERKTLRQEDILLAKEVVGKK